MKRSWQHLSGRAQSAWLLALFLVVTFGPLVSPLSAQPASRIALTAALAEHHTVDIRGYPLGIDHATYKGHLRSDKAPGQPLLAVPVYLVGRAIGAQSEATKRVSSNFGLWWVTFWTVFLPYVALVVLMYLMAARYAPAMPALVAAAGLGVATMMLPLSVNLYGAALAGLTAYAAWALLDSGPPTTTRLLAAGGLAGASVVMEYETAIVLVALGVVVLFRARWRSAWYAVGALGPLLVLAAYQWAAFGKPWRSAHAYYGTAAIRRTMIGYDVGWRGFYATFFGPHGLLFTNVLVLVGIAAAAVLWRSPDVGARRHARLALAIVIPYLVLCIGWRGTPVLEEPGLRYMIPALPFLAVPLAAAWPRLRRAIVIAVVLSAAVSLPAATTNLLVAAPERVFPALLRRVEHHQFAPTLWSIGLGWFGVVLYAVSVVGCGYLLVAHLSRESRRAHQPA